MGGSGWLLAQGWLGLQETRRFVAAKYLKGRGIEVGALGFPLLLPPGALAIYVDKLAREQAEAIYQGESDKAYVDPDRVEDGFELPSFKLQSMDFVVGNHVLEHAPDFFGALARWTDITRVGGHIFAALPIASECFDRRRNITEPGHFLTDYKAIVDDDISGFENSTLQHCRDYLRLACPEIWRERGQMTPCCDQIQLEERARQMFFSREDIHYHTFSFESLKSTLELFVTSVRSNMEIETVERSRSEIVFVLRKTKQ
jgi:hypothetical protein